MISANAYCFKKLTFEKVLKSAHYSLRENVIYFETISFSVTLRSFISVGGGGGGVSHQASVEKMPMCYGIELKSKISLVNQTFKIFFCPFVFTPGTIMEVYFN